ncbi:helix-turn-helix transcriptional regulator [Saccharomonospora sp. CUA-673]|uniref:helix-turn-helix transcriptional regulator n=1 Tax=Saccharomonospora sp. CUA-673 TaxID=1904969 RepID=UPI000965058F|nr:LuxR family transcriptional regulator [Saccharomonospora sp. CUA-673]OLT47863.1 helix-turn-helix transcriptional regulator [Saccharomonospora sp. CUA-673]
MSDDAPALAGRGRASATLERVRDRVASGGAELALVTGERGAGKTALVQAFAARHSGPVHRAAGAAWERDLAYGVVDQLLRQRLSAEGPATRQVAARLADVVTGPEVTLMIVDNAQWADEESLRALVSAVRHHPDAPLLVVAIARTMDRDVLRHATTTVVPLRALDVHEVAELAAARGTPLSRAMAEQLTRHTSGVPLHVMDLLAEVPGDTWRRFDPRLPAPASMRAWVGRARAACSEPARRLVDAAAVLGPGTTVREVAMLAGFGATENSTTGDGGDSTGGPAALLAVADEACASGLVRTGPRGLTELGPAGPMVREAVLDELGHAAAADLRRRAAELVDDPVCRARLLVAATPVPDAALADRLDALAGEHAEEGAWSIAASLLSDAGRLTEDRPTRERRMTRAVDALIGAGDALGAGALVPEIEGLRETPLRNAVLGYLAVVRGRPAEAEARLARAWHLVNVDREPEVAAVICQRYVLHYLCRCRPEELVLWADRAFALAGEHDPASVEAAAIRGLGVAGTGRVEEAVREYAELAERVPSGAQWQRIVMGRGWLDLGRDALDDARADLELGVPTTVLGGSTRVSLWARGWLARAQFLAGDWDEALRTVEAAQDVLDRSGIAVTGPLLSWSAVAVHALRGEWDAADEALRRVDSGPRDYEIMQVPSCLAHALVAEVKADAAGVLRALRPLTRWSEQSSIGTEPGRWPWADTYAHALVASGNLDEADTFLRPHEKTAADSGSTSARARLRAARGRLEAARGELAAARTAFGEALDLLEGLPLRYDRARIDFVHGQVLRRAGKRKEADEALTCAREAFAALGAVTYVERCDRETKAGGVRAQRAERDPAALTPQEQAVSRLVAQGMTNREVAAELYLSTKTVQFHLTRVYAKLGLRSRSELAARFTDE